MIVEETKMLLGFGHTLLVELLDLNGYKKLRNHWRMMINIPGVLLDSLSGGCLPSGVPSVWSLPSAPLCLRSDNCVGGLHKTSPVFPSVGSASWLLVT